VDQNFSDWKKKGFPSVKGNSKKNVQYFSSFFVRRRKKQGGEGLRLTAGPREGSRLRKKQREAWPGPLLRNTKLFGQFQGRRGAEEKKESSERGLFSQIPPVKTGKMRRPEANCSKEHTLACQSGGGKGFPRVKKFPEGPSEGKKDRFFFRKTQRQTGKKNRNGPFPFPEEKGSRIAMGLQEP